MFWKKRAKKVIIVIIIIKRIIQVITLLILSMILGNAAQNCCLHWGWHLLETDHSERHSPISKAGYAAIYSPCLVLQMQTDNTTI
ncbi:hypothetical protein AQUCO_01900032v1 [Aquilegia coerulea]|uniref:Uncharacterized protein n=1 Tax=Aquilegia coerulea TaxID=218851 RepID=A0A2G5DIM2_AQUCA|nr:hypothetical protein AQUCO_01900032v1 [Aquilegia coerulea]